MFKSYSQIKFIHINHNTFVNALIVNEKHYGEEYLHGNRYNIVLDPKEHIRLVTYDMFTSQRYSESHQKYLEVLIFKTIKMVLLLILSVNFLSKLLPVESLDRMDPTRVKSASKWNFNYRILTILKFMSEMHITGSQK